MRAWCLGYHDPRNVMVVIKELTRWYPCVRDTLDDAVYPLWCHDCLAVDWMKIRVLDQASCPVSPHGLHKDGVGGRAPGREEAAVCAPLLPSLDAGSRRVQQDVLELSTIVHVHVEAPVRWRQERWMLTMWKRYEEQWDGRMGVGWVGPGGCEFQDYCSLFCFRSPP